MRKHETLGNYTLTANEGSCMFGLESDNPIVHIDDINLMRGVICGGYDLSRDSYNDAVQSIVMMLDDVKTMCDDMQFISDISDLAKAGIKAFRIRLGIK